jgi:predicted nucleic acid-binding protein
VAQAKSKYTTSLRKSNSTESQCRKKVANRYQIQKIGTVGILLQYVKQEILAVPVAQKALNEMIVFGYCCPIIDLEDFLHL